MTAADTLRAARGRIEEPRQWGSNQGRMNFVDTTVMRCAYACDSKAFVDVFAIASSAIALAGTDATHAEVLAAFDRAIEIAEKQ